MHRRLMLAILAVIGLLTIFSADYLMRLDWREEKRVELISDANIIAMRLENAISSRFASIEALAALFVINPETDPKDFALFAKSLMDYNHPIRAIQFADSNTKVVYVYPPKGNEITIQKPMVLINDPKRGPYVEKAIKEERAVLQGPFTLRQGGVGVVVRLPVFRDGSFSGFAIGVFDISAIIDEAIKEIDIHELDVGFSDARGKLFWGSDVNSPEMVTKLISAADADWIVNVDYKAEFQNYPLIYAVMVWGYGCGFLLLILLYVRISWKHSIRLRKLVKERTSSLEIMNDELVAEAAERMQVEEKLLMEKERAELANRAKTEFLANMSHEIRTPMNGVMGMLQLLRITDLDEEQKEYVVMAMESSKRLTALLSDILDLSRVEAGKLEIAEEPFYLGDVLRVVVELYRSVVDESSVSLKLEMDSELEREFYGDSTRIQQILTNLIGNAVKFTDSGEIRVEACSLPSSEQDKVRGLICVSDTGVGIAADDIETLFKPFSQVSVGFQRRHQGAGLGLSICKRLVSLMGGDIYLDSEPGKGTDICFSLYFKKVKKDFSSGETIEALESVDAELGLRVLVAEDDETSRFSTAKQLLQFGCKVVEAANGEQALHAVKEGCFDLVLMDVQMPVMDGVEAAKKIRQHEARSGSRRNYIMAMTAYAMNDEREAFLEAGMDEYMAKPVDFSELRMVLERVSASKLQ